MVDLWRKLQEEKCPEGDIKAYLTKLQTIWEKLITMGVDPKESKLSDNEITVVHWGENLWWL